MAWKQLVDPDLAAQEKAGWCERMMWKVWRQVCQYGADTARISWDLSAYKHPTRDLPGVAVVGYWSWWGTIDGVTQDWGHTAAVLADGRVLSSPLTYDIPYGQQIFNSIEEVSNWLGATWLGWTEDHRGGRIVEWSDETVPAPSPAPAPSPSVRSITVDPWPAKNSTLWGISESAYGFANWDTVNNIAAANNIADPAAIQPGWVLTIP